LQVRYAPLAPGLANLVGAVGVVVQPGPSFGKQKVEVRLAQEVRSLAIWLKARGPAAVGAHTWGEICLLAPRNDWLLTARRELEAEPLARFAHDLAAATNLAARARAVEPSGALSAELERLLAQAAELGLEGAGPRTWLRELLAGRDEGRPSGKPDDEAINLLT